MTDNKDILNSIKVKQKQKKKNVKICFANPQKKANMIVKDE